MKAWELVARLEGVHPEAEVVVRDGDLILPVDEAEPAGTAESTSRVVLIVDK